MPTATMIADLGMNEKALLMPAQVDPPPPGWITAAVAAIGAVAGAIGAALVYAGNRYQAYLNSKTTLQVKEIDSQDRYAEQVHEELVAIRSDYKEMRARVDTLQLEAIGRQQKISHLELEVERLTYQIARMQEAHSEECSNYETRIGRLQDDLAHERSEKFKFAQRVAELEIIGSAELLKIPIPATDEEEAL